jgi:hypothetical protein
VGVLCVTILAGSPAFAAPSDDSAAIEQVRALGTSGLKKYDQGDFAGALDDFDRAKAVLVTPTLELYAARALVSLGRLSEASRRYADVLGTALPPDASEPFNNAVRDARVEHEALQGRIPRVTLAVEPDGPAIVSVDGQPAEVGALLELDPGAHVLIATREGQTKRVDISLAEGERRTVALRFPASAPDAVPVETARDGSLQSLLGWVAIGVGATGVGVGIGSGIAAAGKKGDLEDQGCTPDFCSATLADEVDGYDTLRTISSIGFFGGVAIAAGGVVLVLTAPSEDGGGEPTAVRVVLAPQRVSLGLTF